MWIVITLFAASFQAVRNTLARSLSSTISPTMNSWARFAFNLPLATLLVTILGLNLGWLQLSGSFFFWCFLTAGSQLLGNVALVAAFRRSGFAQSIVLHKLEVVFAALLGVLFFAEAPEPSGWLGVLLCGVGVLFINLKKDREPTGWIRAFHLDLGTVQAIASGLLLVLTSFFLKEATEELALSTHGWGRVGLKPPLIPCFTPCGSRCYWQPATWFLRHPPSCHSSESTGEGCP